MPNVNFIHIFRCIMEKCTLNVNCSRVFLFPFSLRGASSSCGRLRTSWRSSPSSVSLMPKTGLLSTASPGQSSSAPLWKVKQNRDTGNSRWCGKGSAVFLAGNHVSEQEKKLKARNDDCFLENLPPGLLLEVLLLSVSCAHLWKSTFFWEVTLSVQTATANNYPTSNTSKTASFWTSWEAFTVNDHLSNRA